MSLCVNRTDGLGHVESTYTRSQRHRVGTPGDAFGQEGIVTSATNRVVSLLFATLLAAAVNFFTSTLALGGTFTSYGPRLYERGTANPAPVVTTFTVPNSSTPYTLKIYNGGRTGIRTGERANLTSTGLTLVTPP